LRQKNEYLMQKSIPYMQFRGGSSKGLFFKAEDLPTDETARNQAVILAMEGTSLGDFRQIDGLGGANSLTSKVAIISLSESVEADLDYLFLQIIVGKGQVSTTQTCGNILAGILPFAIESGMIKADETTTSAKIRIVNTGGICEVIVQTPNGQVEYAGNAKVDGVPGTAAPIICNYLDIEGSTCGALLPTGNPMEVVDGIEITCIDNGMPVVMMRANDFGLRGDESKDVLDNNDLLKEKIEGIRIKAGKMMNLGDVSQQTIPKMCLISAPQQGGIVNTRMFIPHVVHDAIGVLAAVSVATACILPNSITKGITKNSSLIPHPSSLCIEHPSGEFTVNLDYTLHENKITIHNSGVLRTARLLSKGEVFIPTFYI
jgi:4-oxalomesaconate tautomerase